MTLEEKIRMCDQMIREDKDATVKDFIETLNEILSIEIGTVFKEAGLKIIKPPVIEKLFKDGKRINVTQTREKQRPLHATKY